MTAIVIFLRENNAFPGLDSLLSLEQTVQDFIFTCASALSMLLKAGFELNSIFTLPAEIRQSLIQQASYIGELVPTYFSSTELLAIEPATLKNYLIKNAEAVHRFLKTSTAATKGQCFAELNLLWIRSPDHIAYETSHNLRLLITTPGILLTELQALTPENLKIFTDNAETVNWLLTMCNMNFSDLCGQKMLIENLHTFHSGSDKEFWETDQRLPAVLQLQPTAQKIVFSCHSCIRELTEKGVAFNTLTSLADQQEDLFKKFEKFNYARSEHSAKIALLVSLKILLIDILSLEEESFASLMRLETQLIKKIPLLITAGVSLPEILLDNITTVTAVHADYGAEERTETINKILMHAQPYSALLTLAKISLKQLLSLNRDILAQIEVRDDTTSNYYIQAIAACIGTPPAHLSFEAFRALPAEQAIVLMRQVMEAGKLQRKNAQRVSSISLQTWCQNTRHDFFMSTVAVGNEPYYLELKFDLLRALASQCLVVQEAATNDSELLEAIEKQLNCLSIQQTRLLCSAEIFPRVFAQLLDRKITLDKLHFITADQILSNPIAQGAVVSASVPPPVDHTNAVPTVQFFDQINVARQTEIDSLRACEITILNALYEKNSELLLACVHDPRNIPLNKISLEVLAVFKFFQGYDDSSKYSHWKKAELDITTVSMMDILRQGCGLNQSLFKRGSAGISTKARLAALNVRTFSSPETFKSTVTPAYIADVCAAILAQPIPAPKPVAESPGKRPGCNQQ